MADRTKDQDIRRVIIIEGLANVVVLIAKLVVGFSTGSLAILGDAIHSLTDVANNIVGWAVVKVSQKPPDREHPYGHKKFETLAVFFLATLLTVLAFELTLHVFRSETKVTDTSFWELSVMCGVLFFNFSLAMWERSKAKQLDSDILLADSSHTMADALTTVVVIIGWQLSAYGLVWVDKLCALGVAGLVFYLAFNLFRKAAPILVDELAIDPDLLKKESLTTDGVLSVEQVRSRCVGKVVFVDLIIIVERALSMEQAFAISKNLEQHLIQKFGPLDISIHLEPERS